LVVSVVQVTVQYPAKFLFMAPFVGLINGTAPGDIMLKASSVMRVESGSPTATACAF
jgi:hypothetical protein